MIHDRQGLALDLEARQRLLRAAIRAQDLERYRATHRLPLLGRVHDAHASLPEDTEEGVGADACGKFRHALARGRRESRARHVSLWICGSCVEPERTTPFPAASASQYWPTMW